MELQSLIEGLSDPAAYEPASGQPLVRQTHISVVFLTSELAYNIKKPVRLRFLDYSSLALRRYFCEEEARLNQRLAPGVYLGVVPVTWDGVRLHMEQPESVVEWAVRMRRLPEEATLSAILDRDEAGSALIEKLAARIAAFHAAAQRSPEIAALGQFDSVEGLVRENLGDAAAFVGSIIDAELFRRLEALTDKRLLELRPLFDDRALRGLPCDAHGDLRLEHVYLIPQREPPEDIMVVAASSRRSGLRHGISRHGSPPARPPRSCRPILPGLFVGLRRCTGRRALALLCRLPGHGSRQS